MSARRLLYVSTLAYPPYVQDYLDRVTAADVAAGNTSGIERGVTDAFNVALQALVSAGQLGISASVIAQAASTIKAMPFLCGARTLPGILTPVVGPAPTNYNFVANDYNRRTGLGDPTNVAKYLDSNRSNSADPQNNKHLSVHISTAPNNATALIGSVIRTPTLSSAQIRYDIGQFQLAANSGTALTYSIGAPTGFAGIGRNNAGSQEARVGAVTLTNSVASVGGNNLNSFVFARNDGGTANSYSNSRIRIYSIGEFVDMAVLRSIQDQLIASIAAAIP